MSVAGAVTRAARPATLVSGLRELVVTGVCVACYPFGVGSQPPLDGDGSGEPAADEPAADPAPLVRTTPVLLVHGYGHNRSGWMFVERHLRRAGFDQVATMNYSPFCRDLSRVALDLADRVDALRRTTGAERVHLVGHSLGGILIRYYVQLLGGDTSVATVVTIASPHEGTAAGHLLPVWILEQLRPDSWVIRALAQTARPGSVRWVAYYSDLDVLVQPGRSAMLRHPALAATNVLVKDHGHMSMLLSPGLGRSISRQLAATDAPGELLTPTGQPACRR